MYILRQLLLSPPALPWLQTNVQFSNISLPGSCLFFHTQHKCFFSPTPWRQTALPSPSFLQWILKQKGKKTLSQPFFSLILSKGYRSFWSTSKCCWQGHNWTFFPLQYRHYRKDDYPSWPYYSLPLATLLHLGANLLAHQVLPHSCHCWHFPKRLLERPLACLTPKKSLLHFGSNPLSTEGSAPLASNNPTTLGHSHAQAPSPCPLYQGENCCCFYRSQHLDLQ